MVCPYLTGLWRFRCTARDDFVIPSITEETRYCLNRQFERCPHFHRRKLKERRGESFNPTDRPGENKSKHP